MQWIQQLYEGGVLPVREIARLCGVTERMIYRYVRGGGWQRRRGCVWPEASPAATARAAKACVTAARQARAVSGQARSQARRTAALMRGRKERAAQLDALAALNDTLVEVIQWMAETKDRAAARERAARYQHQVLDAVERMQRSLSG